MSNILERMSNDSNDGDNNGNAAVAETVVVERRRAASLYRIICGVGGFAMTACGIVAVTGLERQGLPVSVLAPALAASVVSVGLGLKNLHRAHNGTYEVEVSKPIHEVSEDAEEE